MKCDIVLFGVFTLVSFPLFFILFVNLLVYMYIYAWTKFVVTFRAYFKYSAMQMKPRRCGPVGGSVTGIEDYQRTEIFLVRTFLSYIPGCVSATAVVVCSRSISC